MNPGLLLISLAAISWGTTGVTMTLLARETSAGPLLVGFVRMAVAAPLLLVAARVAEGPWRLGWRRDGLACLALGAFMAAYQVCYFSAVALTGIAVTALLAICSAPLMIALLAVLWLGERLTPQLALSLAMGVVGTGLLVTRPGEAGAIGSAFLPGAGLALGAGLAYALYAVVAKASLGRVAPLPLAALTFSVAAVALTPVLLGESRVIAQLAAGWALFLYLGVVPTALAYTLYTLGLRRTPATVAGIVTLLEPLTATALGVGLFGERLGVGGVFGAVLLLGAIALLALKRGA
ncbi:MAG: DMT family transporter [Candidatus Rokubacteria bacterium]|nr:DMT family transporter [Candidatus Rokubacteria bacterium]